MHVLFITANKKFLEEASEEAALLKAMVGAADVLHVVVFTRRRDGFSTKKISDTAWIYPTNSLASLLFGWDAYRAIRRNVFWQREFRAHIVHSDDPFLAGWLGLALARRFERAWMVNLHEYYWSRESLLHAIATRLTSVPVRWLLVYAEHVCVFSERVRLFVASAAAPGEQKKVFVLPRHWESGALRNQPVAVNLRQKYPQFNFIILVAAPQRTGHIAIAIDALAVLRAVRGYGKAGLVMVGRGPLRSILMHEARSRGITDAVVFEDEAEDPVSYFKTANLLLYLASDDEEDEELLAAAASGCAILALPSATSSAVVKDGANGIIIPQATAAGIVAAIRRYNEMPGLREQFRINSAAYLSDTYMTNRESLTDLLRRCWTYDEAPPEEARLEHELAFTGAEGAPQSLWSRLGRSASKLSSRIAKRP